MVDKHHTVKGQRMHIRRSAFFINQIVEVNTACLHPKHVIKKKPCKTYKALYY